MVSAKRGKGGVGVDWVRVSVGISLPEGVRSPLPWRAGRSLICNAGKRRPIRVTLQGRHPLPAPSPAEVSGGASGVRGPGPCGVRERWTWCLRLSEKAGLAWEAGSEASPE